MTRATDKPYINASYWESLHSDLKGSFGAVGYPEFGEGFNRATYKMRLKAVERILKRQRVLPVSDLLEGGVGIGAYGPLWEKSGVERWTGLDIAVSAIEHVAKRYPAQQFHVLDLSNKTNADAILRNREFDLATAIDVLYHIVEDDKFSSALTNIATRVRLNGHLVVSDIFCSQDRLSARHVKRRSMPTYETVLNPLGFELISREPIFAILGHGLPRYPTGLSDLALSALWRALSKLIRLTPFGLRDAVGVLMVNGLRPIDALLRSTGVATGMNLELALFKRTTGALVKSTRATAE